MKLNEKVIKLEYKNKIVLANCVNGYWLRITQEVYEYFFRAMELDLEKTQFFNTFEDVDDRQYIQAVYEKMEKLGIIGNENMNYKKEVAFEITNRCNLNCKHCCIKANTILEELNTEEFCKVFDKVIKYNPDNISISGGEPLFRRDIKDLLKYLRKIYNGSITLATNALLINKDNIEVIKKCIDNIEVSLDGVDEESCKLIRGEDVFERVIQKITFLKENGCHNISLSMVVSDKNRELEEPFKELCKRLGTYPIIRVLAFVGRGADYKDDLSNMKQGEVFIHDLFFDENKAFIFFGNCLNKNSKRMIRANGDILTCPLIMDEKYVSENVNNIESLEEISNKKMEELRKNLLQSNPNCQKCLVNNFCWNCLATINEHTKNYSMENYCAKVKNYYFKIVWGEEIKC